MAGFLLRFVLVPVFAVALSGCGGSSHAPSVRLTLDGPPLALIVQSDSASWKGVMDRGCMAGFGHVTLQMVGDSTVCSGDIDHPATDKGRMYVDLLCSDGTTMNLIYRNLGPDQGMGLARIDKEKTNGEKSERAALFYHPSAEEAERCLVKIREDIANAVELKRRKDNDVE